MLTSFPDPEFKAELLGIAYFLEQGKPFASPAASRFPSPATEGIRLNGRHPHCAGGKRELGRGSWGGGALRSTGARHAGIARGDLGAGRGLALGYGPRPCPVALRLLAGNEGEEEIVKDPFSTEEVHMG